MQIPKKLNANAIAILAALRERDMNRFELMEATHLGATTIRRWVEWLKSDELKRIHICGYMKSPLKEGSYPSQGWRLPIYRFGYGKNVPRPAAARHCIYASPKLIEQFKKGKLISAFDAAALLHIEVETARRQLRFLKDSSLIHIEEYDKRHATRGNHYAVYRWNFEGELNRDAPKPIPLCRSKEYHCEKSKARYHEKQRMEKVKHLPVSPFTELFKVAL